MPFLALPPPCPIHFRGSSGLTRTICGVPRLPHNMLHFVRLLQVEPPEGCSASPLSDDNLFVWVSELHGWRPMMGRAMGVCGQLHGWRPMMGRAMGVCGRLPA